MGLRPASTTGQSLTEEQFVQAVINDEVASADIQTEIDLAQSDAEATAAADLDAHLVGPPTAGAITVAQLNSLDRIGTEEFTAGQVTRLSNLLKLLALTEGSAAGAVALRFGASATEGLEVTVLDEVVAVSSAAASHDLTIDIPDGAVILSVQANLDTAITASTAVKVGIGIAANPDLYGLTSDVTADLKSNNIPDWAVLSGAEDVKIFACDTNGDAAGTIGGAAELVRVRIVYLTLNSLDNA